MTDQDRKAARREIADALLRALERRHEVLDLMVESDNKAAAIEAIVSSLDMSHVAAEAVMGMCFDRLTKDSRKKIQAELEDLNKQLSFTLGEPATAPAGRPATSTTRSARRSDESTTKRRRGSLPSTRARRSAWCSASWSVAR